MPAYVPLEQRFWYHVTPNDSGCWEWTGSRVGHSGHGRVNINQKTHLAHRVAYEMCVADIPDGLYVRHKCDNPPCVNPLHLEVGTQGDNMSDMISRGRARHPIMRPLATHCRSGKHEWIPENIYTVRRKDRTGNLENTCRLCAKERTAVSRGTK
jgi:hypothetical protein